MTAAQKILKQYWAYDTFRPLQEDIINTLLQAKDCIALLPTGGGKSLCYQIPALLLDGVTIVVSPLISLMQDQVANLKSRDIEAEYLHSGLSFREVEDILEKVAKEEIKLLYVSPERIQSRQFKEFLPYISVSLIAVDEAHCISQWGHDFRPEYLEIKSLREACKSAPIIALTATATQDVLADIQLQLGIDSASVFKTSFRRPNIFYAVEYSENKQQYLVQYFRKYPFCSIVYCRSRRKTEELALLLQQNNINAAAYHAGMNKELRLTSQQSWMNNEVAVMVATTAFGMGIDKPDVRTVIHFDAPEHLEAYYQETGRAGRDGAQSNAIALYNHADISQLQNSTALYFPPEKYLRQIYQHVCDYLQIPISAEPDKYYDFDLSHFLQIFKLEAVPAAHSLRLLAQEGLWTLSESLFRPASVQFLADRQILDQINNRYPLVALVSTALLRLYSGIFHYPCTIQLVQLSRHLKMKKEDVEHSLMQLQQMGIIKYTATKEGPQLFFHHYRVASAGLVLNHKRINQLRDNHQKRSEAMIRFLENKTTCINKLVLQYFEEETDESCNHCAICIAKVRTSINPKDVRQQIFDLIKCKNNLSLNELIEESKIEYSIAIQAIRKMMDEEQIMVGNDGKIDIVVR